MTIRELINQLEEYATRHGDNMEVLAAHQPGYPIEARITDVNLNDKGTIVIEAFGHESYYSAV